ncbi:MAG TPA: DUF1559 domain-containing protein [Abditibacterium sp.]
MNKFRLTRREWMLFAFPFALLLLSHAHKMRGFDASELSLRLNPFARARENARRSSCQSNLKQIALGFAQYTQDYDGRFPLNSNPKRGWVFANVAYTKSCPILSCPSETTAPVPMVPDYWMNGNLNDRSGRGVSVKQIDLPEHTFLLGDGDQKVSAPNYTLTEKTWKATAPYAKRHLFGANYAFADGHVKWLKPEIVDAGKKEASCCTNYAFKIEIIKAGAAPHDHKKHGAHEKDHQH